MSGASIPRRDENERWDALIRESEAALEKYLPKISIDLASFIRCLTFRVFLVAFLSVDPKTLAFDSVQRVTEALSDYYDDSKGENTLPPDIQHILYQWLPRKRFPSALDRILPAYEALWRIAATIVVTCKEDETKRLPWVMLDFRDNPWDRQYTVSYERDGKSVSAITNDVVGRIVPIARPQHATEPNWPLNCIQYATGSRSNIPTVEEGLKFAALLASKVIDRVRLQYVISGDGDKGSWAAPLAEKYIRGVNKAPSPSNPAINPAEKSSRAGTSQQVQSS